MPTVEFAKAFQRHVECPPLAVEASTLPAALDAYFAARPGVRGYVLDDQGRVRKHVTLFVDGDMVDHCALSSRAVGPASTIHVFQALSGG